MKVCRKCKEEKPIEKFYKSKTICITCDTLEKREWYQKNKEVVKARSKVWYFENNVRARQTRELWAENNREKMNSYSKKYADQNPEKVKKAGKAWRKAYPEKNCFKTAKRYASKLKSKPNWAIEFFIQEAYHLAKLRTEKLGFKWEVDHIVPLQSKLVCGLHCEQNLQVIPKIENIKKGNRCWPDMP